MKCCGCESLRTSVARMAILLRGVRNGFFDSFANAQPGAPTAKPAAAELVTIFTKVRRFTAPAILGFFFRNNPGDPVLRTGSSLRLCGFIAFVSVNGEMPNPRLEGNFNPQV